MVTPDLLNSLFGPIGAAGLGLFGAGQERRDFLPPFGFPDRFAYQQASMHTGDPYHQRLLAQAIMNLRNPWSGVQLEEMWQVEEFEKKSNKQEKR